MTTTTTLKSTEDLNRNIPTPLIPLVDLSRLQPKQIPLVIAFIQSYWPEVRYSVEFLRWLLTNEDNVTFVLQNKLDQSIMGVFINVAHSVHEVVLCPFMETMFFLMHPKYRNKSLGIALQYTACRYLIDKGYQHSFCITDKEYPFFGKSKGSLTNYNCH